MPKWTLHGAKNGRIETVAVDADSLDAAAAALKSRGYRDIKTGPAPEPPPPPPPPPPPSAQQMTDAFQSAALSHLLAIATETKRTRREVFSLGCVLLVLWVLTFFVLPIVIVVMSAG